MIYVKNDNKIITERILVPKDEFYSEKKNNFILKSFLEKNDFCNQYVTPSTLEDLQSKRKRFTFDSYELVCSLICSEDVLNDFEIIMNCDLPDDVKIKYLKKIDGIYQFSNFCNDVFPFFKLEIVSTYKIDEIKKALDACNEAGVFTAATNILCDDNISIAEDNAKVLKLVRKFNKFNEQNKAFQ